MKKFLALALLALSTTAFAADDVAHVTKAVVVDLPKHVVVDSFDLTKGVTKDAYGATKYLVVGAAKGTGHVAKQFGYVLYHRKK